jgi:hypothetical protein
MIVEVAVGQENVTDTDAVSIFAGLFLPRQRRYSSLFGL